MATFLERLIFDGTFSWRALVPRVSGMGVRRAGCWNRALRREPILGSRMLRCTVSDEQFETGFWGPGGEDDGRHQGSWLSSAWDTELLSPSGRKSALIQNPDKPPRNYLLSDFQPVSWGEE